MPASLFCPHQILLTLVHFSEANVRRSWYTEVKGSERILAFDKKTGQEDTHPVYHGSEDQLRCKSTISFRSSSKRGRHDSLYFFADAAPYSAEDFICGGSFVRFRCCRIGLVKLTFCVVSESGVLFDT